MSLLNKRVLIIDDDIVITTLLNHVLDSFLEHNNFVIVNNYNSGIDLINNNDWDFVLSDQQLGNNNGTPLLGINLLKVAIKKGMSCTLYSGCNQYQKDASEIGCHFLSKDSGILKIRDHIKNQLEKN